MKVIGAGFGRTGTSSLKAALEELGFGPCYHMSEAEKRPQHIRLWEAASRGAPVDWAALFAGFESTVDWPASAFYNQITEAFPDAKVVLSLRDPDKWYESVLNTVYRFRMKPILSSRLASAVFELIEPNIYRPVRMLNTVVWEGVFKDRFENRDEAIAIFKRHIEDVKEQVPAERLLVYDVRDGWEPLCAFLNVPVPAKPFPHAHDTQTVQKLVRRRMVTRVVRVMLVPLLLAASTLGLLLYRHTRPGSTA